MVELTLRDGGGDDKGLPSPAPKTDTHVTKVRALHGHAGRGADEEQVDLMLMSERIAVCEQISRVSPSLSLHQAMCMVEHGRKQTAKIRLDALGASGQVFEPA